MSAPHYATDEDVKKTLKIMAKNSTRSLEGKFVVLENPEIDNLHSRVYYVVNASSLSPCQSTLVSIKNQHLRAALPYLCV